jgi:predicted nucleotidyltransferase component of viral defense system
LGLLKSLLQIPFLSDFYLVGGTALALKFGHRLSVDIDLFCVQDFNKEELITVLAENFEDFEYKNDNNIIGLFCVINGVKVDLIKNHWFKVIDQIEVIEDIRMFGNKDLLAMKVSAILKRGQKKDFYDLATLLNIFTIKDAIQCYEKKYPTHQVLISIPSTLTYFEDAENSPDPISLNGQTWEQVKKTLQKAVRDYLS